MHPPAISAQLILFFCNKCFQEHDRRCLPLWALQALEDMDQFLGGIVVMIAGREQSRGSIGCFHGNLESTGNGNKRDRLRFAFSVQEFVDDGAVQIAGPRALGLGPPSITHFCLEPLCKVHSFTHRKHFVIIPVSAGSRFVALS